MSVARLSDEQVRRVLARKREIDAWLTENAAELARDRLQITMDIGESDIVFGWRPTERRKVPSVDTTPPEHVR
jgi:hypothetical protein